MARIANPSLPMFAHNFAFDPTYGYDLAALQRIAPAPAPPGFADFWRDTFANAQAVPLDLQLKPASVAVPNHEVFEVGFNSLGGVRVRGWLTRPRRGPITRGLVISHGYGEREGPDPWLPVVGAAAIFPCARGLSLSRQPGLPVAVDEHVLHGITARETYVHRGCAADVWAAASALIAAVPATTGRLDYVGGSFGGGIGALALPWDDRFGRAALSVPSFGQHPLRLKMPCVGSGESVRRYARTHPEVVEVLAYFDASVAATYLHIPTFVVPACFDPAVPPPGQFAVANAIAGPKFVHVRKTGHFEWPGLADDDKAERDALVRFLRDQAIIQPAT